MKMRKLLAVVMAVVLAISAMAISVFADDTYIIDMYNYDSLVSTSYTATYSVSIPVYNLYGYATDLDEITLNLPTNFAKSGYADYTSISYTLTVGGVTVKLASPTTVDGTWDTFDQTVEVGTFQRDYYSEDYPAMIPQSLVVNTSAVTMTITAYVDYSAAIAAGVSASTALISNPWADEYYDTEMVIYTDSDEAVSIYYGAQASSVGYSTSTSSSTGYVTIISKAASWMDGLGVDNNADAVLSWDHTLGNRATIFNAYCTEGSTVTLVVELEGNLSWATPNGLALYGLYVYGENATYGSSSSADSTLWYSGTSLLNSSSPISTYLLNGSTSTLTFDVPVSYLYDANYGIYNGTMIIAMMSADYDSSSSNYYYNYANSDWSTVSLTASAVYLEVTIPSDDDDTVVENDDPVEDTNSETEDDELEVDDTDDTTTEPETNPTTGIVLALVPMAVAAAAAVASKRR